MDFEIFTIGGGDILFNFFNAVAAVTSSADYRMAITLTLLGSTGWVLLQQGINPAKGWNQTTTWFAAMLVMMTTLLQPIATVKVTDRIAQVDSSGYIVQNVPWGLAFVGGMTSVVGDGLTRLYEANFADPNAPELNRFGFLFGARLLDLATRMEVKDEIFAHNLRRYIRNCTFYDILLGRKSLRELRSAPSPWAYVSANPSQARMVEYREEDGDDGFTSDIVTCADAATAMGTGWAAVERQAQARLFAVASPQAASGNYMQRTRGAVLPVVQQELGQMHRFLVGASKTSANILRDQMVTNMYHSEMENWNAEHNSTAAVEAYRRARLDLQTRQSYAAVAGQAQHWVPVMRTVFQALFIGVFPIAVLLMLTPMGPAILKNYFMGFLWLESWAALFAILHYMMNIKARDRIGAVTSDPETGATEGITMFAQVGVQRAVDDISLMAGYLSMSVPFISLIIAGGVSRALYLATSTLAVSQEAVGETTRETTTGNFQIGNTQLDTHAYANRTAFQQMESLNMNYGAMRNLGPGGEDIMATPGGNTSIVARVASWGGGVGVGESFGRNLENNLENSTQQFFKSAKSFSDHFAKTEGFTTQDSAGMGTEDTKSVEDVETMTRNVSDKFGITEHQARKALVALSMGTPFMEGVSGSAAYQQETGMTRSQTNEFMKQYGDDKRLGAFDRLTGRTSHTRTGSEGEQITETWADTLDKGRNDVTGAGSALKLFEGQSAQMNENMNDWFVSYLVHDRGLGMDGAYDLLSVHNREANAGLIEGYKEDFFEEKLAPIYFPDRPAALDRPAPLGGNAGAGPLADPADAGPFARPENSIRGERASVAREHETAVERSERLQAEVEREMEQYKDMLSEWLKTDERRNAGSAWAALGAFPVGFSGVPTSERLGGGERNTPLPGVYNATNDGLAPLFPATTPSPKEKGEEE